MKAAQCGHSSLTAVTVLNADDVGLIETLADLNFDQLKGRVARIFHPMDDTERQVDGLVGGELEDLVVPRHARATTADDPMFGAMLMPLEG
jgi:hypothetical protein